MEQDSYASDTTASAQPSLARDQRDDPRTDQSGAAEGLQESIQEQRARLFFDSYAYGAITGGGVGVLYLLIIYLTFEGGRPMLWLALLLTVVAARVGLTVHTKSTRPNWPRMRNRLRLATFLALLNGVVWGIGSVWFPPGSAIFEITMMQTLLLAGVPAGALASLAAYWPAYLAYAGSGLLIYAADLLFNELYAETGYVLACAVLAYLALMLVTAWGYQRTILESLRYRFAANDFMARMQTARAAAEAASRAKSRFLANMSHEIRTPLNGNLGMADLLQTTPLGDVQRRYCDAITSSGRALRDLLGDVLDLSKIEAGKIGLEQEDFDLSPGACRSGGRLPRAVDHARQPVRGGVRAAGARAAPRRCAAAAPDTDQSAEQCAQVHRERPHRTERAGARCAPRGLATVASA